MKISAVDVPVRLLIFATVLALMAVLEAAFPRRPRSQPRTSRWVSNLATIGLGYLLNRVASPVLPIHVAAPAHGYGRGLLPALRVLSSVEGLIAVLMLHGVIYLQHVLIPDLPTLWRLHMVHHADLDLDDTTGVRFHLGEIFLLAILKSAAMAPL